MPRLSLRRSSSRVATFEPLEAREMLSVSPEWLVTLGGSTNGVLFPYVAGHEAGGFSAAGRLFAGTVDFDPGPGTVELANPGPNTDVVVARYGDAGGLLWARRIGDSDPNNLQLDTGVATDRLGNTYLLGIFQGAVDIGTQTFTGDYSDGFVAKLDPNGNFLWSQPLRASSSRPAERDVQGIAIDDRDVNPANWSVFVSGYFKGTATLGTQTLKSTGQTYDTFISKLSADSGTFQWNRTISGQGSQEPAALAVAESGAQGLYVSGDYDTEAKIGATTLTGGSHFLAKLNPGDGSTIWAKSVAAAATYGALAATADGVVVGGGFSATVDFDPGAGIANLTSAGGVDSSLLKLDTNGNFLWARRMGGASDEATQGLAVNAAGGVYLTGAFVGTADFGSQILAAEGGSDGFLAELNAAGAFVGAFAIPDHVNSVAVDGAGDVYTAGSFGGTALDHFPTGDSAAIGDAALLKFSPTAPPIDPTPSIHTFVAAPETVFAGEPLTLSVIRVHDPAHQIQTVTFYRDNGDGVLNPADDAVAGADSNSSGGWTAASATTGLPTGSYTFFAQASDAGGAALAEAATQVDVLAVEVASYASANVPKAIPDLKTITSTLTVPDSFTILDLDVTLNISHTGDTDLDVYLIGPDGTRVELFTDVGSTGDNFTGTTLDDEATTDITSSAAPFSGRFRPEGLLSAFDGKSAAGVWTLEITDDVRKDTGTLNSWSLNFTREAMPMALAASQAVSIDATFAAMVGTPNLTSVGAAKASGSKHAQPVALAATITGNGQPTNLLLAAAPTRSLSSKAADSAITYVGLNGSSSTGWKNRLDDELLLDLALTHCKSLGW